MDKGDVGGCERNAEGGKKGEDFTSRWRDSGSEDCFCLCCIFQDYQNLKGKELSLKSTDRTSIVRRVGSG
jgi:hypothetical protein